jgi:hypothetical protein
VCLRRFIRASFLAHDLRARETLTTVGAILRGQATRRRSDLAIDAIGGAGVEDLSQQPQIALAGVPGAPVVLAVDAAGDRADRQGIFRRDEDAPAGCWGWSSAGRRRRRRGRFVNGRPDELRRRVEGG